MLFEVQRPDGLSRSMWFEYNPQTRASRLREPLQRIRRWAYLPPSIRAM